MDNSITVETDMFEHKEVKLHFINPCCFGEDFAAWLKHKLSLLSKRQPQTVLTAWLVEILPRVLGYHL